MPKQIEFSILKIEFSDFSSIEMFKKFASFIGAQWDDASIEYLWNMQFGIYPLNTEITGKVKKLWFDTNTWWTIAFENETHQTFFEGYLYCLKNIPASNLSSIGKFSYPSTLNTQEEDKKDNVLNQGNLTPSEKELYLNSILDKISAGKQLSDKEKDFLKKY